MIILSGEGLPNTLDNMETRVAFSSTGHEPIFTVQYYQREVFPIYMLDNFVIRVV
jgi:hypothetical protein